MAAGNARKGGINTYGLRRRHKGKMVGPEGSPRSFTHGGRSQATGGYECGSPPVITKLINGKYRVSPPTKRRHRGITRDWTGRDVT